MLQSLAGAWALHVRVVTSQCVSPLSTAQGSCPTALCPQPQPQHNASPPLKDIKRSWASATYLTPQIPLSSQGLSSLGHQGHRVGWGQLSAGQTPPLVTGYTTQEPGCPPACCGRHRQTARDPVLSSSCSAPPCFPTSLVSPCLYLSPVPAADRGLPLSQALARGGREGRASTPDGPVFFLVC